MKDLFYRILTFFSHRFGNWVFLMIAWFVAAGYFLFFPRRVAVGVHFYASLFPGQGPFQALGCTWRQYHAFVRVFLDRFRLEDGQELPTTYEGWEHIVAAAQSGRGAIILMSHLGGWEIAARLMQHYGRHQPALKLMLFLGAKREEQIEGRQKRSVSQSGIRVVSVPEEGGTGMEILEGLQFLREGGLVSLTGDRIWGSGQRAVTVRFGGGLARIPEIPYILALVSGAPLIVFFGVRTGGGGYHLSASPPMAVTAASRAERGTAIGSAAQAYADLLAEKARRFPAQWFHFEPFLMERESGKGEPR